MSPKTAVVNTFHRSWCWSLVYIKVLSILHFYLQLSTLLEIRDRQGPRIGARVHSDYATTTMMMKDDLCQKWRVKLIFQGIYRLSGVGIVESLKIINVGCNLKQFDVESDRRCIFHFRPKTKKRKMTKYPIFGAENENEF